MNRYWSSFVVVCLMVVPCWAEDNHNAGLGFSKPGLVKSSFAAGRTAIEMYADSRVDVTSLLADLDLSRPASAQSISDHVNAKRKQLYPDEEIVLSIASPPASKRVSQKLGSQPTYHESNHGDADHGFACLDESLIILTQATEAT